MKLRDKSCGLLGEDYSRQKGQQVQRPGSKNKLGPVGDSRGSVWLEWHE